MYHARPLSWSGIENGKVWESDIVGDTLHKLPFTTFDFIPKLCQQLGGLAARGSFHISPPVISYLSLVDYHCHRQQAFIIILILLSLWQSQNRLGRLVKRWSRKELAYFFSDKDRKSLYNIFQYENQCIIFFRYTLENKNFAEMASGTGLLTPFLALHAYA